MLGSISLSLSLSLSQDHVSPAECHVERTAPAHSGTASSSRSSDSEDGDPDYMTIYMQGDNHRTKRRFKIRKVSRRERGEGQGGMREGRRIVVL